MSNDMMNRIWWREDLDPTTKFVAIALADGAGDEGELWPSVGTIMQKTSLKRRTVQTAIAKLEGMNLVRRVRRFDSSNVYLFVVENLPLIERKRGHKERGLFDLPGAADARAPRAPHAPPRASGAPPPRTTCALNLNEPSDEPSLFDSGAEPAPGGEQKLSIMDAAKLTVLIEDEKLLDAIATRWNDAAERHPGVQKARLPLDDARKQAIRLRSKRTEDGETVQHLWDQFFQRIEESTFLQGREPPGKGRSGPFTLSLTWALKSTNFNEIMEGKYGGNSSGPTHTATGRRMGPAEQAGARTFARFRAAQERGQRGRGSGGDQAPGPGNPR